VNNWSKRNSSSKLNFFYDRNLDNLIPPSFEGKIYRIIQEALTNITKHSNSKIVNISIFLKNNKKNLEIKIFNNGVKNKLNKEDGVGLLGMIERVNQMNGTIYFKKKNNFEIIIILKIAS
jgi:two-component system sensor histidine kinase UhpB